MCWTAAILVIVSLVTPFTFGVPDTDCNYETAYKEMRDLVTLVQDWKAHRYPEAYQIHKISQALEDFTKVSEDLFKNCGDQHKQELSEIIAFPIAFIAGEKALAEMAISGLATKNEEALSHILSLMCAFDCSYILKYTHGLQSPDSKKHVYQTLTELLQHTNINHTVINTDLQFITDLHKITHEETDAGVSEVLKSLLHQAIKTDLILQHHTLEGLYGIDKQVTSEVVQELIVENINIPIKSDDDLELFPLFEIIKCPDNLHLWIEHLQLILINLKESNKVKSIYTLILLKDVHYLEEKVNDEEKQKLLNIKNEMPELAEKILSGNACVQIDEGQKKYKAFVPDKLGAEVVKFVPKEDGSFTTVSAQLGEHNYTLLLDRSDDLKDVFDFTVNIVNGELAILTEEDKCEVSTNVCIPFADVLPPITMTSAHFDMLQQFVRFYIGVSQTCANNI